MYRLDRHLGHEFIVEDARGHMYVCYRDENHQIHSIDESDDFYMVPPFNIFERNTEYTGKKRNTGGTIKIIDCYWPSMSECENSAFDIRAKIQFKDQYGEWYQPGDIDIFENNQFNCKFDISFLLQQLKNLKIQVNDTSRLLSDLSTFKWDHSLKTGLKNNLN